MSTRELDNPAQVESCVVCGHPHTAGGWAGCLAAVQTALAQRIERLERAAERAAERPILLRLDGRSE